MLAALSGGRQIIAEFPVQLLRWSNAGRPACGESRRNAQFHAESCTRSERNALLKITATRRQVREGDHHLLAAGRQLLDSDVHHASRSVPWWRAAGGPRVLGRENIARKPETPAGFTRADYRWTLRPCFTTTPPPPAAVHSCSAES